MQYEIKHTRFDNGATLYYMHLSANDISVIASVNAGSLYETKFNNGISHLVEHMIFKGTPRRESRDAVYKEMRLLGDQNFCHTDSMNIPLGMRVVLDDFDSALDLISDLLYNSKMAPEEIEKEKSVVLSEIRDRYDDSFTHLFEKFNEMLFNNSRLAFPQIGYADVVKSLKPDKVFEFYKKHFNPANTTVFVVGPIPFEEAEDRIDVYFGKHCNGSKEQRIPPILLPTNAARNVVLQKQIDNVNIMTGRVIPHTHKDYYAIHTLASVMSRSLSEKLLNDEPFSYNRWIGAHITKFAGQLIAYATAAPKNFERVKELIFEEFAKYAEGKIPESYVRDVKQGWIKCDILENPTTMGKAQKILEFWLDDDIEGINTHLDKINNVTIEQIKEAGKKYIRSNDLLFVSLGNVPKHTKTDF